MTKVFHVIFVLFFIFSAALNIGSFVGSNMWKTTSNLWTNTTGSESFFTYQTAKTKDANLRAENAISAKKKAEREFSKQSEQLAANQKLLKNTQEKLAAALIEVSTQKSLVKKLQAESSDPLLKKVLIKGVEVSLKEVVSQTSKAISKRVAKSAKRSISILPAESLPYLGAAVVVGATIIEFRDHCSTLKELAALNRIFDASKEHSKDQLEVCSMRVPSPQEVWTKAKTAPDAAWATARETIPTLNEINEWDLPNIDYNEIWASTKSGTADYGNWIKDKAKDTATSFGETIATTASDAAEATTSKAETLKGKVLNLFDADQ